MSTIHSPFSSWLITTNSSSVLIVFCQFFHLDCTRLCRFTFLAQYQCYWRGNCISCM